MADISELISSLLEDPETGNKLKALLSSSGDSEKKEALEESAPTFDPALALKLTKAMSAMGNVRDDSRARLLQDLKPYISEGRCKRVDEAVKILSLLRAIDIMGGQNLI